MGNSNRTTRRLARGFSLTELLVAMAIFSILATALVTLFTSAVHSVRTGYASIAAHEQARTAMNTMSRDLSLAFTAREFGDVYNFYGRHDGFMFVGALDGGRIGRVTYVLHDELPSKQFESVMIERWGIVRDNVRRQAERIARDYGYSGAFVQAAGNQAVTDMEAAYVAPGDPVPPDNLLFEFNVIIEPQRLVRYEEPGQSDLDYFDMRISTAGAPQTLALPFPYVDPIDPARDDAPGDVDGSAQLDFLYGALNPVPGNNASDLRNMYVNINQSGGVVHPVTNDRLYLRVLNPNVFEQLLNARKREFWIRMLSSDPLLGVPALAGNGFWHDEESGADNSTYRKRVVNEYVVADGIIGRAILLDPDGAPVSTFTGTEPNLQIPDTPLDGLDADVKFQYSDGENGFVNYFNAIENLSDPDDPYLQRNPTINVDNNRPDIPAILANGNGTAPSPVDLVYADNELAGRLLGVRSTRENMGSPLTPRLPAVVAPEFWVTRPKRQPNAPDFRRRFTQAIQVPAATGRTTGTTIAQGPGSAL